VRRDSSARTASSARPAIAAAWTAVRTSPPGAFVPAVITPPRLAADMIDPRLAALSTDAALDAVPTPSTDVTEPIDPIEAKLPTDPMLSALPRLAMDRIEFSEAIDHFDGMAQPLTRAGAAVLCRTTGRVGSTSARPPGASPRSSARVSSQVRRGTAGGTVGPVRIHRGDHGDRGVSERDEVVHRLPPGRFVVDPPVRVHRGLAGRVMTVRMEALSSCSGDACLSDRSGGVALPDLG
jgi:hypothetical protein